MHCFTLLSELGTCLVQFLVRDRSDHPGERDIAGVDWRFNAWGGITGGLYKDWREDNRVLLLPAPRLALFAPVPLSPAFVLSPEKASPGGYCAVAGHVGIGQTVDQP